MRPHRSHDNKYFVDGILSPYKNIRRPPCGILCWCSAPKGSLIDRYRPCCPTLIRRRAYNKQALWESKRRCWGCNNRAPLPIKYDNYMIQPVGTGSAFRCRQHFVSRVSTIQPVSTGSAFRCRQHFVCRVSYIGEWEKLHHFPEFITLRWGEIHTRNL